MADLGAVRLDGANLNRAHLNRAKLDYASLLRASLVEAELYEANLKEAEIGSSATFSEADLTGANLTGAYLEYTDLSNASLEYANLSGADLRRANLRGTDLNEADLSGARLNNANLSEADLSGTILKGADLSEADLSSTILIRTNLKEATLVDCSIYGISAWKVQLEGATQENLIIVDNNEPIITVDNLKIAQFIYLLLDNQEIRDVIDTITSKVVLILGRFTPERKVILDALREELRKKNYLPIVFDFDKPASRDLTETISTLTHMARFVIADITQAKSIPQELERVVPDLPSVPVQPLLQAKAKEYGMFEHFKRYPWVLEVYRYTTVDRLLASLKTKVIEPAEQKVQEIARSHI